MRGVRRFCMVVLILTVAAPLAMAGVNAGGKLFIHTNSTVYSDGTDYCGLSERGCNPSTGCPGQYNGGPCDPNWCVPTAQAGVGDSGDNALVFYVMAAFPAEACPRLKALTFGLSYDEAEVFFVGSGTCADFEIIYDSGNWPGNDNGVGLTWDIARQSRSQEVYWFAAYAYGPSQVTVAGHVTQGAKFADDSVPAVSDNVTGFGVLGMLGGTGLNQEVTPTEPTTWGKIKASYGSN